MGITTTVLCNELFWRCYRESFEPHAALAHKCDQDTRVDIRANGLTELSLASRAKNCDLNQI
jgi:hypothetical protein